MSQDNDEIKNDQNSVIPNRVPNSKNEYPVNNVKVQDLAPYIREQMVSKATDFLNAIQVKNMPMERKVNFLRLKGLTDQEIQVSLQRASAICPDYQDACAYNNSLSSSTPYYSSTNPPGALQIPYKSQSWFRRLFGPITLTAVLVYTAYQIYKKYLRNWLFGTKKSEVEELSSLQNSEMFSDNSTMNRPLELRDLDQLRAELKSIKSLLLNRNQFPPPPTTSTIPQWQLTKIVKPQVEQHNKVNGINTPETPLPSLLNLSNTLNTNVNNKSDKVIKDEHNLPSNETMSQMGSNQNTVIKSSGVIDQNSVDQVFQS